MPELVRKYSCACPELRPENTSVATLTQCSLSRWIPKTGMCGVRRTDSEDDNDRMGYETQKSCEREE